MTVGRQFANTAASGWGNRKSSEAHPAAVAFTSPRTFGLEPRTCRPVEAALFALLRFVNALTVRLGARARRSGSFPAWIAAAASTIRRLEIRCASCLAGDTAGDSRKA